MSPLRKSTPGQITDERKLQIKEAALKIFARHGFLSTKTSMIAAEAGISEGLIYRYFRSKDELFMAILEELLEIGKNAVENVQHLPGTPTEQIKTLTEGMLDEQGKYAFMLVLRSRKDAAIPEQAKQLLAENSSNAIIDLLVPVFIKGQQSGEFMAGEPRKLLSWYLYTVDSLILEEVALEEYGLPDLDILMRLLKK